MLSVTWNRQTELPEPSWCHFKPWLEQWHA